MKLKTKQQLSDRMLNEKRLQALHEIAAIREHYGACNDLMKIVQVRYSRAILTLAEIEDEITARKLLKEINDAQAL